jgi:NDP-sugar pyrophosphorylase family protein|tara:strand:- start:319 stop:1032 length:714 start_codon:yes stop_codon:yes gene_type:complete
MIKRAVILAGGKGTRLKPLTRVLPKPLMPIGKFTILEIVIRQLKFYGFKHITIAVNHQAKLIKAFFGNGKKFKISIDYILEKKPLGTMGPLKGIVDLPENFLVMNGDILTDLNFNKLYNSHLKNKNLFTISSHKRKELIDYGLLKSNKKNYLTKFLEKPNKTYQVSMGIYVLRKKILKYIPRDKYYGFDHLMYKLLKLKKNVKIRNHDGYWLDIGRPSDYIMAVEEFKKMRKKILHA